MICKDEKNLFFYADEKSLSICGMGKYLKICGNRIMVGCFEYFFLRAKKRFFFFLQEWEGAWDEGDDPPD